MERTERTRRRAPLWRVLVLVAVVVGMVGLGAEEAQAADAIENEYEATPGIWGPVVWRDGRTNGCASGGRPTDPYTVVYPTSVGDLGDHPVVIWGNGTDTTASGNATCSYEPWLRHLASWGFVVIAPNVGQTGRGIEMRQAADYAYLLDAFNSPTNPLYDSLDTSHMAAAGHSQGAIGAINAVLDAPDSVFSSVLSISTPDRDAMAIYNDPTCSGVITDLGCCAEIFEDTEEECIPVPMPTKSAMSTLAAPIFFVTGSVDPISEHASTDWFPNSSPAVPYAYAERELTGHVLIIGNAEGYNTAWLLYTAGYCPGPGADPLDPEPAFRGANPEIGTHPDWENSVQANLHLITC